MSVSRARWFVGNLLFMAAGTVAIAGGTFCGSAVAEDRESVSPAAAEQRLGVPAGYRLLEPVSVAVIVPKTFDDIALDLSNDDMSSLAAVASVLDVVVDERPAVDYRALTPATVAVIERRPVKQLALDVSVNDGALTSVAACLNATAAASETVVIRSAVADMSRATGRSIQFVSFVAEDPAPVPAAEPAAAPAATALNLPQLNDILRDYFKANWDDERLKDVKAAVDPAAGVTIDEKKSEPGKKIVVQYKLLNNAQPAADLAKQIEAMCAEAIGQSQLPREQKDLANVNLGWVALVVGETTPPDGKAICCQPCQPACCAVCRCGLLCRLRARMAQPCCRQPVRVCWVVRFRRCCS
ncbi:MAG: hypothetical protein NTY19_17540 [Planctomycetota bacterium]|nr:hypothetical protein [Planctomycetota bacterium]